MERGRVGSNKEKVRRKKKKGEMVLRIALAMAVITALATGAHAAVKVRKVYRKSVNIVKLEPRYFVTMKNGKVYEAKKIKRHKQYLVIEMKGGKKVKLARAQVKAVRFGFSRHGSQAKLGRYVSRRKDLKPEAGEDAWDKYELWRGFGGHQHWSDTYGNNRQVKR